MLLHDSETHVVVGSNPHMKMSGVLNCCSAGVISAIGGHNHHRTSKSYWEETRHSLPYTECASLDEYFAYYKSGVYYLPLEFGYWYIVERCIAKAKLGTVTGDINDMYKFWGNQDYRVRSWYMTDSERDDPPRKLMNCASFMRWLDQAGPMLGWRKLSPLSNGAHDTPLLTMAWNLPDNLVPLERMLGYIVNMANSHAKSVGEVLPSLADARLGDKVCQHW